MYSIICCCCDVEECGNLVVLHLLYLISMTALRGIGGLAFVYCTDKGTTMFKALMILLEFRTTAAFCSIRGTFNGDNNNADSAVRF